MIKLQTLCKTYNKFFDTKISDDLILDIKLRLNNQNILNHFKRKLK